MVDACKDFLHQLVGVLFGNSRAVADRLTVIKIRMICCLSSNIRKVLCPAVYLAPFYLGGCRLNLSYVFKEKLYRRRRRLMSQLVCFRGKRIEGLRI